MENYLPVALIFSAILIGLCAGFGRPSRKSVMSVRLCDAHLARSLQNKLAFQNSQLTILLDLFPFLNDHFLIDMHELLTQRVLYLSVQISEAKSRGKLPDDFDSVSEKVLQTERSCKRLARKFKKSIEENPYPKIHNRMKGCFFCSGDLGAELKNGDFVLHGIKVTVPLCVSCEQLKKDNKPLPILVTVGDYHKSHWAVSR